jgi:hypothetical protein
LLSALFLSFFHLAPPHLNLGGLKGRFASSAPCNNVQPLWETTNPFLIYTCSPNRVAIGNYNIPSAARFYVNGQTHLNGNLGIGTAASSGNVRLTVSGISHFDGEVGIGIAPQQGANVIFEAGDVIHLTNGFQVSGGSFSAYTSSNIPSFPICYDAQRIIHKQPKDKKQNVQSEISDLTVSPNPSASGIFTISFNSPPSNGELVVFNAMGAEVKRIENIQDNISVSLAEYAKGIYLFRYRESSEKYQIKKVVFN